MTTGPDTFGWDPKNRMCNSSVLCTLCHKKILITSPPTAFLKNGQLDFSKVSDTSGWDLSYLSKMWVESDSLMVFCWFWYQVSQGKTGHHINVLKANSKNQRNDFSFLLLTEFHSIGSILEAIIFKQSIRLNYLVRRRWCKFKWKCKIAGGLNWGR